MILKGSNALIVKYEVDLHRHAGPSPSTGYKYVDNGFFFFFKIVLSRPKAWMSNVNRILFSNFFFPNLYFKKKKMLLGGPW